MLERPDKTELETLKKRFPHRYKRPVVDPTAYVASGVAVEGDVTIAAHASLWFNAVLRGDVGRIVIGEGSNVQDLCMVHVSYEKSSTLVGNHCTIGHSAILHGCQIGNHVLVGMGSLILDNAQIGDWVMLGAGSLVTEGKKIPSGTLAFGRPAKVIRELTDKEREYIAWSSDHYRHLARTYL
ncbi:MAG: gamma carbonic anhydrase family protein [Bdellovibrionales bacterium]|nr:gamma carbonic anhydrase family protein [Bdellovibrionales bacterium]